MSEQTTSVIPPKTQTVSEFDGWIGWSAMRGTRGVGNTGIEHVASGSDAFQMGG